MHAINSEIMLKKFAHYSLFSQHQVLSRPESVRGSVGTHESRFRQHQASRLLSLVESLRDAGQLLQQESQYVAPFLQQASVEFLYTSGALSRKSYHLIREAPVDPSYMHAFRKGSELFLKNISSFAFFSFLFLHFFFLPPKMSLGVLLP